MARFIHGEVVLQEKEELEAHLAVCASCENLYGAVTDLDRILRDAPDRQVEPPPYLRPRILANLPEPSVRSASWAWGRWAAALCGTAACALIAFAVYRGVAPGPPRVASRPSPPAVPAPPVAAVPAESAPVRPSPPPVAAAPRVEIIREVKIYFYYPPAQKVAVTGDFNGWDPKGVPLTAAGKPGLWETKLRLKPGAYSYNFIVDGDVLVPDPNANDQAPDGFGGTNSILLVKEGEPA